MISPSGKVLEFFSEALSNELAVSMGHGSKGTIIFEAELLAVWVTIKLWKKFFTNAELVIYNNNDAVRGAYAACISRTGIVGRLLEFLNLTEDLLHVNVWVARVPTKCKIAELQISLLDSKLMIFSSLEPSRYLLILKWMLSDELGEINRSPHLKTVLLLDVCRTKGISKLSWNIMIYYSA